MIKVGIIGCGNIFESHAKPLEAIDGVELAAVCDINSERATAAAQKHGAKAYTDYRLMITGGGLDAVHICTAHYLHAEMCVFALEHGLDVICEKPMAIKYDDSLKMKEASERTGSKLCIIFQNRYNPGSVLIKNCLDSGRLGRVLGAKCEVSWHRDQDYYKHDDWRGSYSTEGGGVIINQAIHTLDLMRWLIGSRVSDVSASVSHRGDTLVEVEDTAEGRISFEGGIYGNFYFTTTYSRDARTALELHCEKGIARLDAAKGVVELDDGTVYTDDERVDPAGTLGKIYWGSSHFRQISAFYNGEIRLTDDLQQALETQKLVCNIYASAGVKLD